MKQTFTFQCTNEKCLYEEDLKFESRKQAEETREMIACPKCGSEYKILLS